MWVLSIIAASVALYAIHCAHAAIFGVRDHSSRARRWLLICATAIIIVLLSSALELAGSLVREPAHEWTVVLAGLGYMAGLCIADTVRARREVTGSTVVREED